jgi:hypothetical protein
LTEVVEVVEAVRRCIAGVEVEGHGGRMELVVAATSDYGG